MIKPRLNTINRFLQRGFVGIPFLKRKFRNSRPGSSGGGGGASGNLDSFNDVLNLTQITDFAGIIPFINRIKCSNRPWNDGTINIPETGDSRVNSNYEIAALPPGQTLTRYQFVNLEAFDQAGYVIVKAGTYTLKWDGACVVDVINDATGISTVGNVTTFTLSDTTTHLLQVRVRNLTGSNASATNIRMVHADHEAAFVAGEILDPDFVTWVNTHTHAKATRYLDWQNANFGAVTNAADLTPLTHISWCQDLGGCPPEIIGEMAKKTGKNIWTVMWRLATDACMTSFYTRVLAGAGGSWTGKILVEGINEAWNGSFPGSAYLHSTYYTTITLRDASDTIVTSNGTDFFVERLNSSYAHHSMRCWAAADAVFGSGNVVPIGSTQTGFPAVMSQWPRWFQTGFQSGQRARDPLNARGRVVMTNYFSIWSAENAAGRTGRQMCEQDYGNVADATWLAAWKTHVDQHVTDYWGPNISNFVASGYTGKYFMYEGGCHDFVDTQDNSATGWSAFSGVVNTGDNTLDMGAFGVAWLTDGDVVKPSHVTLSNSVPSFDQRMWARKIPATTKIRLYPSLGAYTADSGNTGAGAATLLNVTATMVNVTRHDSLSLKIFNLNQGAVGLDFHEYQVGRMREVALDFRGIAIYACPAPMRLMNQRFTYCFNSISRGIYAGTESASMAYIRGLNIGGE
jgi:hypothetical protein